VKILVVAPDVPWPPTGGARTRNAHLIDALATAHDVTVAALHWGDDVADPPPGITLHTAPWELPELHRAYEAGDEQATNELFAPDAEPYGVGYFASPPLERLIERLGRTDVPDVTVLTETATARFRSSMPDRVPFVLDLHDVHAVKAARYGKLDEAARLRRFESAAAADAAVTVCVSSVDAQAARDVLGASRVEVVPNGVDTRWFVPDEGPGDDDRLVFTGSLYTRENIEAMTWFVEEVLPLVRARRPGVQLDLVGARPPHTVQRLAGDGVHVHANVPDTRPYLWAAGVAVVPLLNGGGTRLKILEAAATGRSIVSTSVGAEGLPLRHGHDVELADDTQSFADAVVRLCGSRELRVERAAAARKVADAHDWRVVGAHWRSVVESVA